MELLPMHLHTVIVKHIGLAQRLAKNKVLLSTRLDKLAALGLMKDGPSRFLAREHK